MIRIVLLNVYFVIGFTINRTYSLYCESTVESSISSIVPLYVQCQNSSCFIAKFYGGSGIVATTLRGCLKYSESVDPRIESDKCNKGRYLSVSITGLLQEASIHCCHHKDGCNSLSKRPKIQTDALKCSTCKVTNGKKTVTMTALCPGSSCAYRKTSVNGVHQHEALCVEDIRVNGSVILSNEAVCSKTNESDTVGKYQCCNSDFCNRHICEDEYSVPIVKISAGQTDNNAGHNNILSKILFTVLLILHVIRLIE